MFLEMMLSAFVLGKEYIKEKTTPVIPAEYWNNKELIDKDRFERHISSEEFMRNLRNGRYYLPEHSNITKAKAKQKKDPEHRVRIGRGGWFGEKEYKEFIPYGDNPRFFKVYDEDWKKWLIVVLQDEGMYRISGCKYSYSIDVDQWEEYISKKAT